MHVCACSTCALSRLQLTFTDTAFLLAGSAAAAALSCSAHTLCMDSYILHALWICVRPTSGATAIWFDSGKCQASRRCSRGLLQLSSLMIINTWTASRQLQWLYTYRLHAASVSPLVQPWAAVASHPSLCVREAVHPTFWDLDISLDVSLR